MGLFSRKPLTPDEKDVVRELWQRSQDNPSILSEQDTLIVNELYSRLDAEDPFRTALDLSSSGKISDEEALAYVNKYGYKKPTRKLYKQIKGLGQPEAPPVSPPVAPPVEPPVEPPSSTNITDVNSVLETEKKKQIIQQAIEEKNAPENIQSEFYNTYDINPFEKPEEAFNLWFDVKSQQNPIELAEYFEDGTLDLENINESFTEALNAGKLDKEFGVVRPGDELKEETKFDKSLFQPEVVQPESTTIKTEEPPVVGKDIPERDIWQAASELKLSEIVPFYTSSQEAIRLAKALKLIGQLKSGNPISNDDKTFLKELADDRKFEKSTIAAQAFDTVKEMIPFAGEIFATYGIFGIAKKGTQKLLSRKIKSEIKDYVEKGLLIDTSSKIVKGSVFVTETALLNKGFLTLSKMDDKISLEKQLPQFEFANNGLLITEQGMDKHTADKQATYDASREFLTEIVGGRFLQKLFPALKKGFNKITNKLTPGQAEVAVAQATTNTIGDAIQRVTGVTLRKQDLIKARQLLQSFGYDGVLEEWGEERIGDATNELVYALANAKDENGESLLPGFDNEEYADNVVRDLAKGDLGKAWERTAVEFLAFSVPAGGAVTYAGTKSYLQEKTIKQKLPFLSKQISDAEERLVEIEPQINKLTEIEKPNPDDVIKLSDLLREKQKINTLQQLKEIIIDNPEIADEVDLSKIDLDKEVTLTQKELEEQGVTLKGEGQKEDQEISKVLGHTVIANSKLQLGLNEGASYDTVLEEYYGLVRRGGLNEEQRETYNEHYEKYKTDENYRIEVNEFINDMHEKMGLEKPIADTSQSLSSDKLFDKEGKSYEYKSAREPKQDMADKVYDYVGRMFKKVFGRSDKTDEMKEVYKKVEKRKLKISSKRAQRQEEREERKVKREAKKEVKIEKKRKKLKPTEEVAEEQEFEAEEYETIPDPTSSELPKIIKTRKKEAKKVKEKKKIFNFIKNRTKKIKVKKIEKLSPVAMREIKAKIERAPEVNIPDDQREPLEILRAVLGDEQFTELTGIPSGPIANLDKIDPKIIPALTKKFPEYMASLKKIDIIDLIPIEEQNKIINQVSKVVGKKTIEPIRLKKLKPKKIPKGVSYQLAPASLSNQKYGAIKGFVKELAKEGEPARFWYEQSGKALLDITGGNKEEAKKLLSIIAITSPQMDVSTNFGQMIKGYYKAIKGDEPLAGRFPQAMSKRIEKVMAGEEFRGLKTDKFYKNLVTVIDGGVPDVTVDMWMMRAFGIDKDRPTEFEYRQIENHVQNIANDLGWEPHQVQAAIWTATKARWESIYGAALKHEKKVGRYLGDGKWKSPKAYKDFRKKIFKSLKKVELKDRSLLKAGYNYKDAIDKYKGRISFEVIPHPSTNIIPGVHDASYKEKLEYHKAITDILVDENGQDIIAKTLKIPTITKHNSPGFYEGESNPSHHTEVLFSQQLKHLKAGQLDKVINEETINNIELYAAVEGLITNQQAVGYTKEFVAPSKKLANAVGVESDTPITEEQLQHVYEEMINLGIDTGPMPTDYGFIMVNFMDNNGVPFSGVDNNTFYDNVENVLDKVFGDVKLETGRFASLGGLLENDWRKDKNGENYKKRINQSNRQDAIKQLVDTLNGEISQVNKAFSEKYGWDTPKKQEVKPEVSYQLEPTGLKTLYHVTNTKNIKNILKQGLLTGQKANWRSKTTLEELGGGELFAFEYLEDAEKWVIKSELEDLNPDGSPRESFSILKIDNKDDMWAEDVMRMGDNVYSVIDLNMSNPKGLGYKRPSPIKPENISVVDKAKPSFQLAPTKPELFSPALRSIEDLQANSLKRQGLLKHFKRNFVPKSELDWLGVMEWARENYKLHESILKQDLIDYIKANQSKLIVTKASDEGQVNEEAAMEAGWKQPLGETHWLNENESWMYDPADGKHTEIRKDNTLLEEIPLHAPSKHESHTMIGGEDYTELLVRHPDGTFVEPSHWDIPGIIVSLRLTTRYDSKGNKILFIEEIQSDWTSRAYRLYEKEVMRVAVSIPRPKGEIWTEMTDQEKEKYIKQAKKKVPKDFGYVTRKAQAEYDRRKKEIKERTRKTRKELYDYVIDNNLSTDVDQSAIENAVREAFDVANPPILEEDISNIANFRVRLFTDEFTALMGLTRAPTQAQAKKIMQMWIDGNTSKRRIIRLKPDVTGFEDTPYKHTADSMPWITLGVKNAILHAVNNNFDKIAVATPEQIEDMYDLSKKISEIRYRLPDPNAPKTEVNSNYLVEIYDLDGNRVKEGIFASQYFSEENLNNLEPYLGKGIIDKIRADDYSDVDTGELATRYIKGEGLRTQSVFHQTIYNATADALYKQGRRLDPKLKEDGTTVIDLGNLSRLDELGENVPSDLKRITQLPSVIIDTPRKGKPSKKEFIEGVRTSVVIRKSIDLTDPLKDKVKKTGIPSFQLRPLDQPLELPDETLREIFVRKIVNSINRLEQVSNIGDVDEQTNAHLAAILYEGRAEERISAFNKWVEKYIKQIKKAGFSVDDIGEYLYAKHAIERNKKVHEDDPDFDGTGSGMTDAEARKVINKYKGKGIHKFATQFYKKVIQGRLEILYNGGLINKATYDLFKGKSVYKNYVPLKGVPDKEGKKGIGSQGFSVVGKDIKRKRGRNSRADNPFVQALVDYQSAIVRAEKNRVSQKFYLFALENPSESWEAKGRSYIPRYNKEGEIQFFDPKTLQENQVQAFIDGKLKVITIHDQALLNALKNLGTKNVHKYAYKFNAYLRAVLTTFNPEFMITNFERDIQTALINIQADSNIKVTAKIIKDLIPAGTGVWKGLRDWKKDSTWKKWYKEYKEEGGAVGWFMTQSVEEKLEELEKVMKRAQSRGNPMQVVRYLGKFIEDMNMVVEQAVRLSTYKNLRESGLSKGEAAKISKELTVNFNQKGEMGSVINSMWLFSNATIQGNYIWMRAFARSNKVKAITMGLVVQSMIMSFINRMNGGDDWERVSDWEKDNNWLYMLPNGDVIKFRVPYGYNVFHVLGNVMEEAVMGKISYGKALSRMLEATMQAFSPFGSGTGVAQFVPTIFGLKWGAEIYTNENFMGRRIYPDQPPYSAKKPDSQLYFNTVRPNTKATTDWLNKVTGGSEKVSGNIDMSPEALDHLIDAIGGGSLRFIRNSLDTGQKLIKGGEFETYRRIPFVRQVITEPSKWTMKYKAKDMLDESARTVFSKEEKDDFKRYIKMARKDGTLSRKDAKKWVEKFNLNQRKARKSMK